MLTTAGGLSQTLRHRAFSILWMGVFASYMAQWMLALAAQWFLVGLAGGADLVPLVQVALTLPMALLAIPAGVLADNLDRRRLILIVQSGVLIAEIALVVLASAGQLRPAVLLLLLVLVASGGVLTFTPVQSMVPDVVDRDSIPAATALLAVATNSARIVGPAMAGLVIAIASVGTTFAATLPLTMILLVAMIRWKAVSARTSRERFMPAIRSGFRFVRHSPQVLKLVLRGFWFTVGIVGLVSLLPVLAAGLGANSAELGLLLAAQGLGAVVGALALPWLRGLASPNAIVASGFVLAGAALLVCGIAGNLLVLGLAVFASGWSWTATLASLSAGMQLYLPAWVRARGIAVLLTAIYGGQAVGAVALGWMATAMSMTWALEIGAAILGSGALLAAWLPLKDLSQVDRSSVDGWNAPELMINPHEIGGQVQVRIAYTIPEAAEQQFQADMHLLRRVRLRTGAIRWQLLKDAEAPGVFVEEFTVGSWAEFEHQRQNRAIASDLALERSMEELSGGVVATSYLFRVETARRG